MVIIVEYKYHSKYMFHLCVHLQIQWMEPDLQWTQVQRAHQKDLYCLVAERSLRIWLKGPILLQNSGSNWSHTEHERSKVALVLGAFQS